jgi:hypothetical protein
VTPPTRAKTSATAMGWLMYGEASESLRRWSLCFLAAKPSALKSDAYGSLASDSFGIVTLLFAGRPSVFYRHADRECIVLYKDVPFFFDTRPEASYLLGRIPEHCEAMTCGTRDYRQMPDEVTVSQARIGRVKSHTSSVSHASCDQP